MNGPLFNLEMFLLEGWPGQLQQASQVEDKYSGERFYIACQINEMTYPTFPEIVTANEYVNIISALSQATVLLRFA